MQQFEETLHQDLHQFLLSMQEVDERLPECPDVEDKWEDIAKAYIPDGIREFQDFPSASLGWMMYIGMAIARFWDEDWDLYKHIANLYALLRDKRGYDQLDEYVREGVLLLRGDEYDKTEQLVSTCATRTHTLLMRQGFEPGTVDAMKGYVASLRQLYLMGMSVELHRLGYHMTRQNI